MGPCNEIYAKRLQIREKLTAQVANTLFEVLQPRGVTVVIEAAHQCMTTRGVKKSVVTMVTSRVMLGGFRNNTDLRNEFFIDDSLIFSVPYVGKYCQFPICDDNTTVSSWGTCNGEESSFLHNAARTAMDWFLALALTTTGVLDAFLVENSKST